MRDRRGLDRPSNGDRKICPKCHASSVEFSERYRLPESDGYTAAWVCDSPSCGYGEPVRDQEKLRLARARRRMTSMRLRPVRRNKTG